MIDTVAHCSKSDLIQQTTKDNNFDALQGNIHDAKVSKLVGLLILYV